jgi:hypothetical protein
MKWRPPKHLDFKINPMQKQREQDQKGKGITTINQSGVKESKSFSPESNKGSGIYTNPLTWVIAHRCAIL